MSKAPGDERNVLEIERPEQLKALGHPLRLKVLQALGESDGPLTNRELAARLEVDPGHLHFHVRMLARAGLIEPVPGQGREKPYRPVAQTLRIGPEIRAAGLASEVQATQLGELRRLRGDLLHRSAESLESYVAKQNRYTSLQAEAMHARGERASAARIALSPIARFLRFYVVKRGFLDGIPGFAHIAIGAFASFLKYAKLRALEVAARQP